MKLSELFMEITSVLQREEVPAGSIGISCEADYNGKREQVGKKFTFEYNTLDGKESITGKIQILRPNTRDEDQQLEPDGNVEEQYREEFDRAEEVVLTNMDKIYKLKDEQHMILKVK